MTDLVLVDVGGGLHIWHTRAEWARYLRGTEPDLARLMTAPIELDPEEGHV